MMVVKMSNSSLKRASKKSGSTSQNRDELRVSQFEDINSKRSQSPERIIDSHEFEGDNIRFLNKPAVVIKGKHVSGLTWKFDATPSTGTYEVPTHRFQWDLDYKRHFNPNIMDNFKNDSGDRIPLNDFRIVEYTFPRDGKFQFAMKIFEELDAEATEEIIIENVGKGRIAS
jgi:hypothetical protein